MTTTTTNSFAIRESGKNGTVELQPKAIVRTIKRFVGKDDVTTIPVRSITSVHHDRKAFSTDIVRVTSGHETREWKVVNAQEFVDALNELICAD